MFHWLPTKVVCIFKVKSYNGNRTKTKIVFKCNKSYWGFSNCKPILHECLEPELAVVLEISAINYLVWEYRRYFDLTSVGNSI